MFTRATIKASRYEPSSKSNSFQAPYQASIDAILHDTIIRLSQITGLTADESVDFLHTQLTEQFSDQLTDEVSQYSTSQRHTKLPSDVNPSLSNITQINSKFLKQATLSKSEHQFIAKLYHLD